MAEKAIKAHAECGHTDWYGWSIENWGTKWNSYSNEIREEADGLLVFKMETAWSYPEPIMRKVAEKYPDLDKAPSFSMRAGILRAKAMPPRRTSQMPMMICMSASMAKNQITTKNNPINKRKKT